MRKEYFDLDAEIVKRTPTDIVNEIFLTHFDNSDMQRIADLCSDFAKSHVEDMSKLIASYHETNSNGEKDLLGSGVIIGLILGYILRDSE